jgi:hypothetical protein
VMFVTYPFTSGLGCTSEAVPFSDVASTGLDSTDAPASGTGDAMIATSRWLSWTF